MSAIGAAHLVINRFNLTYGDSAWDILIMYQMYHDVETHRL